jgi:hypothetical protein
MLDGMMKKGEMEEWGIFPEVHSGYLIGKGEAVDALRNVSMFFPHIVCEVHEIIPYEKYKETLRAVRKAQIAAIKK